MEVSGKAIGSAAIGALALAGSAAWAGHRMGEESAISQVRSMMEANPPRVKLSCANGAEIITDNVTVNEPDLFSLRKFRPLEMQPVIQNLQEGGCAIVPYLAYHYISTDRRDKNNPDVAGRPERLTSEIAERIGLLEKEADIDWSKPDYEVPSEDFLQEAEAASPPEEFDPTTQYTEDGINEDGLPYKAGDLLPE